MREAILFIICLVPLAILSFTAKYDKDIRVHWHKKNIIYLTIFSIAGSLLAYFKFRASVNMILVAILLSYLIIISFTDQMIKKVYQYINILYCIIGISIYIMCTDNQLNNLLYIVMYIISVIIMSKMKLFAWGDVEIFIVLSFYIAILFSTYILLIELLFIHMLIALIIFTGINIKSFIKKEKIQKPYALSISIATIILICLR